MTLYSTIADAIFALLQKHGIDVCDNIPLFIALLSDYAPNHAEEQRIIRAFARAGGMARIVNAIEQRDSYASVFSSICEIVVKAFEDEEHQHTAIESVKKIVATMDDQYAECADPSSIFTEGMAFFRRFPKEENIPIAILLFEESWENGFSDSLQYLSSIYLKGKGIPRNIDKGMMYLKLASEAGNLKASLEFAEHLWKGINIEKDLSHAVAILKQQNDSNAYYMLGEIYCENAEYENAFEYYLKGAENDHVYAQYSVALAYATGRGVKRDMQKALGWLRSAASLGHGDARKKLKELGEKWD